MHITIIEHVGIRKHSNTNCMRICRAPSERNPYIRLILSYRFTSFGDPHDHFNLAGKFHGLRFEPNPEAKGSQKLFSEGKLVDLPIDYGQYWHPEAQWLPTVPRSLHEIFPIVDGFQPSWGWLTCHTWNIWITCWLIARQGGLVCGRLVAGDFYPTWMAWAQNGTVLLDWFFVAIFATS